MQESGASSNPNPLTTARRINTRNTSYIPPGISLACALHGQNGAQIKSGISSHSECVPSSQAEFSCTARGWELSEGAPGKHCHLKKEVTQISGLGIADIWTIRGCSGETIKAKNFNIITEPFFTSVHRPKSSDCERQNVLISLILGNRAPRSQPVFSLSEADIAFGLHDSAI